MGRAKIELQYKQAQIFLQSATPRLLQRLDVTGAPGDLVTLVSNCMQADEHFKNAVLIAAERYCTDHGIDTGQLKTTNGKRSILNT